MSVFQRIVLGARARLASEVELCVLPNENRKKIFQQQTNTKRIVECVWNVPSFEEVRASKDRPNKNSPLKLFYGGTLTPKILPKNLLQCIEETNSVELHIVGYATYSEGDYLRWLREIVAKKINIKLHGSLSRHKMLQIADICEAAICLYSPQEKQINFKHLAGASNKPFDAMARGLAVVISDLPQWAEMYLSDEGSDKAAGGEGYRISDMGYGIGINPECEKSIRGGLDWMLSNRTKLWEMGERGRLKILKEWNYETMFKKIQIQIEQETNVLKSE